MVDDELFMDVMSCHALTSLSDVTSAYQTNWYGCPKVEPVAVDVGGR